MSTNTKQVLSAAGPFVKTNELVEYLVNMITFYEQDLKTKIQFMRVRMEVLEKVVEGCDYFHYRVRSDIGKLATDMDIIQGQIFEMTSTLVIVLNTQCDQAVEW
ncbi:hypothetical protein LCGC14_1182290 [marine sediment metagenome]|uniref:Uncharacterized protein n=1 Tax=marine sediment metagenome TaxID=412755 RepID=A0A0F9P4L0_9ZZZZ